GINLRRLDDGYVGISVDETTNQIDIQRLWQVFAGIGTDGPGFAVIEQGITPCYPPSLQRTSSFLTHPSFNRYHSETEMLRYLRWLADKDIALDRSMIP